MKINNLLLLQIKKPPVKWRFFLLINFIIIHFLFIIFCYYNNFIYLFLIDLLFLLLLTKVKPSIFIKMLFLSLIIIFINGFFINGKILVKIKTFYLTYDGIRTGLKKASLIFVLYCFTNLSLLNNKHIFLKFLINRNQNLIVLALTYFIVFWDLMGKKFRFRAFYKTINNIYHLDDHILYHFDKDIKINFNMDYIYHLTTIFLYFINILLLKLF